MKVHSVSVGRFRSIAHGGLATCGDFNVLVGKNNSGKSNLLASINAFFVCIADNDAVALNPPIGRVVDFHGKRLDGPISITLLFSMTLAERDALIRDVVAEAPQMKNALDGLDPSLKLAATVAIFPPPASFACVSIMALVGGDGVPGSGAGPDRLLFGVGDDAARELFTKAKSAWQHKEDAGLMLKSADALKNYSSELFSRERSAKGPGGREMVRYVLNSVQSASGSKAGPDLVARLEGLLAETAGYEEFSRAVTDAASHLLGDASRIEGEPLRYKVVTFAGEQAGIPAYVRSLLARISSCKVLYLRDRRRPIGREEAARLLSLKVKRGGPQLLRNIQDTVAALMGVQIDAFESEAPPRWEGAARRGESGAEMDVDNFLADVNGSGIKEALRIVLDFEFERPGILLIEEPEIYLHPSLETSMMLYLKRISSDCQVFISTHSTNFLDTGDMKNVYLVSKTESTRVQLLDREQVESEVPRELGLRLSSLFMFDRLVFVEGRSDEAVLREWASTLRVNLSQHNVGFIHMGGVRNFTHFAAERVLSFLSKRQVRIWFIIDHDEQADGDIARLKELVAGHAVVKVLDRRQIENYMISPPALSRFIDLKRRLGDPKGNSVLLDCSEIEETLQKTVEPLREVVVEKHMARLLCSPVYPNRKRLFDGASAKGFPDRIAEELDGLIAQLQENRGKIAAIHAEQTERVAKSWPAKKLTMAPGDAVLDSLCQVYGVRFNKEVDSPRLARLMSEAEIPSEMQEIVREIGKDEGLH